MSGVDARAAAAIVRLAGQREISLKELAEKLQLPYRTVQNYLTGKVKIPALFIERVCDYFGVEADFLLFGTVDINAGALEEAIRSLFSDVIPRLQFDGMAFSIGPESKAPLSDNAQYHHMMMIAGEIATALREQYDVLRTAQAKDDGVGGIQSRKRAVERGLIEGSYWD